MKTFPRSVNLAIGLALLSLSAATNAWPQAFTDVTSRFAVAKSGLVLNRATNTFNSVVTLTNVSSATIKGSLVLLVSNVTAGSVTLANKSGQSAAGMPYLTLPMPAGGLATGAAIPNVVLAFSNPTRVAFTFSISVASMEGVQLPGAGSAPAISVTTHMPPVGVDPSLIQNGVFLSRLSVTFAQGATVDQINQALALVGGGIVSSAPGLEFVTVAVPVQPNAAGVEALAAKLRTAPGILWAFPGQATASNQLPVSPSLFQDTHLLPTRFPAAWNTIDLARKNCLSQPKLPVLVIDNFQAQSLLPPAFVGFNAQIPGFQLFPLNNVDGTVIHGYDVTTTVAALFDNNTPTGANPVTECLDVTGVQTGGIPDSDVYLRIQDSLPPSGRFIANYSQGFLPECATGPQFTVIPALQRAQSALLWIAATSTRWGDFLVASSAGNCLDDKVADIYRGYEDSRYNSPINIATLSDPTFSFMVDKTLWDARDGVSQNLTASGTDRAIFLVDYLSALQRLLPETNVLVTGSTRAGTTFNDLSASSFSASNIDVNAVGEGVLGFGGAENGTSFSTPQVAGLASYLWLLDNDLRNNRPVTDTREAIIENTRSTGAGPTIDAYATILSLDAPGPLTASNAPIRMGLLDTNKDTKFDEKDIAEFLAVFQDTSGNPLEPTARDYSRFDLNGDGFTGGSKTEMFDLDRAGSTQYGKSIYSSLTERIEAGDVTFNENQVTDMQVLCYYAYSGLYQGSPDQRSALLVGKCTPVTVKVIPGSVTLAPGGNQAFSAQVTGAQDQRVVWTATCGGIGSSTGLYTAPSFGPTCVVSATSVADPAAFGQATVTITAGETFLSYVWQGILTGQITTNPASCMYVLSRTHETDHIQLDPRISTGVQLRIRELAFAGQPTLLGPATDLFNFFVQTSDTNPDDRDTLSITGFQDSLGVDHITMGVNRVVVGGGECSIRFPDGHIGLTDFTEYATYTFTGDGGVLTDVQ